MRAIHLSIPFIHHCAYNYTTQTTFNAILLVRSRAGKRNRDPPSLKIISITIDLRFFVTIFIIKTRYRIAIPMEPRAYPERVENDFETSPQLLTDVFGLQLKQSRYLVGRSAVQTLQHHRHVGGHPERRQHQVVPATGIVLRKDTHQFAMHTTIRDRQWRRILCKN